LKSSPASPARLELVQRLDWVTGVSTDTAELALVIARSGARASATASDRRIRIGLVERRVEEMRGEMGTMMSSMALAHMLYVYSPLTDAELKTYVDFLASPAGRAYNRISHVALLRTVRDTADRAATEIMRAVPSQRWAASTQKTAEPPAP